MKKLFFVLFLFSLLAVDAQIAVGPQIKSLLPDRLARFKKTKTVFVCKDSDDSTAFERELKKVWTITELSCMPYSRFKKMLLNDSTSFIFISGITKSKAMVHQQTGPTPNDVVLTHTHIYLSLTMRDSAGYFDDLFRVDLQPNGKDGLKISEKDLSISTYFYSEGELKNWNLGMLKVYLKYVNNELLKEERRWLYANALDKEEIKKLKDNVLYVTNYALNEYDKFTADESKKLDANELFKSYPYKYQLISAEELGKLILKSDKPIYYLVYVRSSTDKYVTVFNSETGNMLYSQYTAASYNIKPNDISRLARFIAK